MASQHKPDVCNFNDNLNDPMKKSKDFFQRGPNSENVGATGTNYSDLPSELRTIILEHCDEPTLHSLINVFHPSKEAMLYDEAIVVASKHIPLTISTARLEKNLSLPEKALKNFTTVRIEVDGLITPEIIDQALIPLRYFSEFHGGLGVEKAARITKLQELQLCCWVKSTGISDLFMSRLFRYMIEDLPINRLVFMFPPEGPNESCFGSESMRWMDMYMDVNFYGAGSVFKPLWKSQWMRMKRPGQDGFSYSWETKERGGVFKR